MTPDEDLRRLLTSVDEPGPVPADFDKALWSELQSTLNGTVERFMPDATPNSELEVPTPDSNQAPEDSLGAFHLEQCPDRKRKLANPRLAFAAAAILVGVIGLKMAPLKHETEVTTAADSVSTAGVPADSTPPPVIVTTSPNGDDSQTTRIADQPIFADPTSACSRFTETVGDSADELEVLLAEADPGWQESAVKRILLIDDATSVLARDLAASPELDHPALEVQLDLAGGALGQLKIEVLDNKQEAALNTVHTMLAFLSEVAALTPGDSCVRLRP